MRFHLNYTPTKSNIQINPESNLLLLGSCFSEHIGSKLAQSGFRVNSNPFGVTFNPLSISKLIDYGLQKAEFDESSFLEREDNWFNYNLHSSIYAGTKTDLKGKISSILSNFKVELSTANFLFLTFGSAYYYKHNNSIVANCHKQPQSYFTKELLDIEKAFEELKESLNAITKINPTIRIIFTISPVLHTKDGVEENFLSKSTLRVLIEKIIQQNNFCFYFPAYELIRDDLRDYRFYENDLVHPNKLAIDYVYTKLKQTYFSNQANVFSTKVENFYAFLNHKPLHVNPSTQKNIKTQQLKENLLKEYPFLNL